MPALPDLPTWVAAADVAALSAGTHTGLADVLGAHPVDLDGVTGTRFAVWAPRALGVAVAADVNGWDPTRDGLRRRDDHSGLWEGFVAGVGHGDPYRYVITGADGRSVEHADPFARHADTPPANASKVWRLDHTWGDGGWLAGRGDRQRLDAPIAVYELHLGSWRRGEDGRRHLTYREVADPLIAHVRRLGFTHVELLPLTEHPFYGSWGYQSTGYFAPTSRYGAPEDLMWLVDRLHQAGIGVILDWVPSHFPDDWWGLARFDGQALFEHPDPQRGRHPDWSSAVFDYGRPEVRAFLISSAMWWLRSYHVDGLRLDAVASMLYLDYSRGPGEWTPNVHGGTEHLEAIDFLRQLTDAVHAEVPDALLWAEESTAWPGVTAPTAEGGLGFDLKWDLGWTTDVLAYLAADPIHRGGLQDKLTFRSVYQHDEAFALPLSHDEVVADRGSLLQQLHGEEWQRRANLRALLGLAFTLPGKPLVFMGDELGQDSPWDVEGQVAWSLLEDDRHTGVLDWTAALAAAYRDLAALHAGDADPAGFAWVDAADTAHSVISFLRRDPSGDACALVVGHFTPVVRAGYGIGVPVAGRWRLICTSDDHRFGGSGVTPLGPAGEAEVEATPAHGHPQLLRLTLPPLSISVLVPA